jgi:hypothetical protein
MHVLPLSCLYFLPLDAAVFDLFGQNNFDATSEFRNAMICICG